jgi:hypothetical protein
MNFFKKQQVDVATKEYPAIVQEIHHEFETAGEKLLCEAKQFLQEAATKDKKKGKLLASLGFINTQEAKMVEGLAAKEIQYKNQMDSVAYYHQNYPFNKFITEDQVRQICEKYGLVCGGIERYKGFVPNEKLIQISNFNPKEKDVLLEAWSIGTHRDYKDEVLNDNGVSHDRWPSLYKKEMRKAPLQICAPSKDMILDKGLLVGYRIVDVKDVPDPVVLQPVKGGFLIICAWGDEASDPLVVNQINN